MQAHTVCTLNIGSDQGAVPKRMDKLSYQGAVPKRMDKLFYKGAAPKRMD